MDYSIKKSAVKIPTTNEQYTPFSVPKQRRNLFEISNEIPTTPRNSFNKHMVTPIKSDVPKIKSEGIFSDPNDENCPCTPIFKTPCPREGSAKKTPQLNTAKKTNIYELLNVTKEELEAAKAVPIECHLKNLKLSPIQESPEKRPKRMSNELPEVKINNIDFLILGTLGKGGSSVVYNCYNPKTQVLRAVKCVSLEYESAKGYINEVELLRSLQDCSKVIKMYDYEVTTSKLYMVLEVGGADLATILRNFSARKEPLPTYKLIFYWMEILYAVQQIHKKGVVHADLKPANFIECNGTFKLIDFGIARRIQNDKTSVFKTVQEGSFNYISPEALRNEPVEDDTKNCNGKYKINCRSDVWSLGCILYEMVYKRTPFHHIGQMYAKLSAICDPHHVIDYPQIDNVPATIMNSLKKCLQYEKEQRPCVDKLIQDTSF